MRLKKMQQVNLKDTQKNKLKSINMKRNNGIILSALLFLMISLTSCEVVGGIFKAGMWTAVIIIVLVVALIFWLISKFRK
jgi:Flp pilus assembly protein TadB